MNPESTTQELKNTYTDAPALHPNLILGGLQLLFWFFFHPSAWRNYVTRIDPSLRPDFCLAELSRAQWRNPTLRRLLVAGYILYPLLVGLLISPVLWVFRADRSVASLAYSVAQGVTRAVAGGLLAGAALGIPFGMAASVTFGLAYLGEYIAGGEVSGIEHGVAVGLLLGVMVSVASRRPAHSLDRQIGSIFSGVLIVVAAFCAVALVAYVVAAGIPPGAREFFEATTPDPVAYDVVGVAMGSVMFGLALGWRTHRWRRGMVIGVVGGAVYAGVYGAARIAMSGLPHGLVHEGAWGVADGVWGGAMRAAYSTLPYALVEPIAGPWAGATASALVFGGWLVAQQVVEKTIPFGPAVFSCLISILSALTLNWWRPVVLYPLTAAWNLLLHRADERRTGRGPTMLRYHSAFWDEHQPLPLLGLEEHLVLVMERDPVEGEAAIEYLATGRQRWAARAAQIELDARGLERCEDVECIRRAHRSLAAGELEGPASALLRSLSRISQDVDAALRQESTYNRRLALSTVEDRLDGLLRELTRSSERYAVRFRPIATRWRRIIGAHVRKLAEEAEARQEIVNPYVIGVPLTEQQEIFVGRTDIGARIEGLLLDRRGPPLLLYGQRRTGKTSLLNNLGRLLPSTIVPLFVDLQGPATQASDHAGFLYNVARFIADSARRQRGLALPRLPREALASDPFTRFDEWLDEVEKGLGQSTALLALDEFETLDSAITRGRFDEEAILGTLRHLIQHRPRFKVLLSGSHTLDELQRWASYLINAQVVHIGYLKEHEARRLIERPVRDFALRYEPRASQRVLDLTRGHPFLVQLLCAEIVALKNEQPPAVRRLARLSDVEAAVPEALSRGSLFFADIERNQVDTAGLALLRFIAARGEGAVVGQEALARQFPDELERALALLRRRELIEPVDGGYRFQVELIRRWFGRGIS